VAIASPHSEQNTSCNLQNKGQNADEVSEESYRLRERAIVILGTQKIWKNLPKVPAVKVAKVKLSRATTFTKMHRFQATMADSSITT
jgi:YbbR domain-containing protein